MKSVTVTLVCRHKITEIGYIQCWNSAHELIVVLIIVVKLYLIGLIFCEKTNIECVVYLVYANDGYNENIMIPIKSCFISVKLNGMVKGFWDILKRHRIWISATLCDFVATSSYSVSMLLKWYVYNVHRNHATHHLFT